MKKIVTLISCTAILLFACNKKDDPTPTDSTTAPTPSSPQLIFKFKLDSTLARLDNFGDPIGIPVGNSAQSPQFKLIGAHSIEFAPDSFTQLGMGEIVYTSPKTTAGGTSAVDFDQVVRVADGEVFYSMPLANVTAGSYEWARVALTYQNYDITFLSAGTLYTGRLASFVDDIMYIRSYTINTKTVTVNANKIQGYWGFETLGLVFEGQTTGTTVPNPIAGTSPIPPASCVVTGKFPTNLTITGNETSDIVVTFNLSTNNSFEWKDLNADGFYEPSDGVNPGDTVVDMGLRGLFPTYQ